MKTEIGTPFSKVCEILVYGNTEKVGEDLHICTEFGVSNFDTLAKANEIQNGDLVPTELDQVEIREVWNNFLLEEFGLSDQGFEHFIDILNAF